MSKERKERRCNQVSICFNSVEIEKLRAAFSASTCRSLTEYCRNLVLQDPVSFFTRNKSFDDFIDESVLLRNEMRAIREKTSVDSYQIERLIRLQEDIKKSINQLVNHVCADRTY